MATCGVKIKWGMFPESISVCDKDASHVAAGEKHEGPGLAEFDYQRIVWFPGDRREFAGEWTPCTRLPGCVLHEGHHGMCAV